MNDREYYITRADGRQEGPYSEEQLASRINAGKYPPDTLVWTEGMDDWAELSRLFPIAEKTEQPDLAADSSEQSTSLKAQHTHYLCIKDKILTLWKTNLKWRVASCGIVVCILAGLFCININSCPSRDEARKLLAEEGVNITSYNKALTQALRINDIELVKLLLIAGLDEDGLRNAIMFCIEKNHIELANIILSNPHNSKLFSRHLSDIIEYNRQEILKLYLASSSFNLSDLNDALMRASRNGHPECVRLLLATPGIDVNVKDRFGDTALIEASANGRPECVRLLLATPGIDVNVKDSSGYTALMRASFNNHHECVRLLLAAPGIDVNVKDSGGYTALRLALAYGHGKCVQFIVNSPKFDISVWPPIHQTIVKNNTASLQEILSRYIHDEYRYTDRYTDRYTTPLPLQLACLLNRHQCVRLLLATPGIDVNEKDRNGYTALMWASANGHPECVRLLLATPGIDVNMKDSNGYTALMRASRNGHPECVRLLLATPGIDVNVKDSSRYTALIHASANGHPECVRLLLATPGIDVNVKDSGRNTALMEAVRNSRPECVRLLLATPGIDVYVENTNGNTALKIARWTGDTTCEHLLIAAGVNE